MKKLIVAMLIAALLAACAFAEEAGIANPWRETDPEELRQVYGYGFAIPEDAEDISWLIKDELQMAEMRFYIDEAALSARVAAMDPEDISGMYYDRWDVEEPCLIDGCEGTLRRVTDEGMTIDVCLWYDPEQGMTWSLTAEDDDLDGFDITAVAEQLYLSADETEARDEGGADEWETAEDDAYEAEYLEDVEVFEEDEIYGESDESEAYERDDDEADEPDEPDEPEPAEVPAEEAEDEE